MATTDGVVAEAEALMAQCMQGYDSSHDMYHVRRVRDVAVKLAVDARASMSARVDLLVVEIAALFHDLVDHKYAQDADRVEVLRAFLQNHGLDQERISTIVRIVEDTGFSRERRLKAAGLWSEWHDTCIEFACIQDADRLDAMGAFGVMRVSAYACRVNHPLHDPDPSVDSAVQHFYDKLLGLSSSMRTPLGKQMGVKRHAFMELFLTQLKSEYAADS